MRLNPTGAVLFLVATMACSLCASGANLAPNPGFEDPAGVEGNIPAHWESFHSHTPRIMNMTGQGKTGKRCVIFVTQKRGEAFQGLITRIDVTPGETYDFEVFVKRNTDDPLRGGAYGCLVLEWHEADGDEIERVESEPWSYQLSAFRWDRKTIESVTAPPLAAYAVFGIHLVEDSEWGRGSFYVDDVSISVRVPKP